MEKENKFEQDEIIINITELISVLWKKVHIIVLAGIIFALAAFSVTKLFVTPKYNSVTKIYVISKQNENSVTFSDLQTGTQLTKDYLEMVKSRPVMESVISALNLEMSPGQLAGSIMVERIPDTRIIKIIVQNEDPQMARRIADEVRDAASIQIKKVMNIDAVNTVEKASLPVGKASPNTKKNTMLGGCFGAFLAIVIIIVLYLMDDTIKTAEDVERYLGLNVLAAIPTDRERKRIRKEENEGTR